MMHIAARADIHYLITVLELSVNTVSTHSSGRKIISP